MKTKLIITVLLTLICKLVLAQVTTSSISGVVINDNDDENLMEINVVLTNLSTNSKLGLLTNENEKFRFNNIPKGSYEVMVSLLGFKTVKTTVEVGLDQNLNLDTIVLKESSEELEEVVINANLGSAFISSKAGSSKKVNSRTIQNTPQIDRSINSFSKLTPQSNTSDFAGFSGGSLRASSVTIDGTSFTNFYGLGGAGALLAGNAANAEPISLDALDEIKVNLSPYDVRQGGFTGANINAVTKSGTNKFQGTIYSYLKNDNFVGNKVEDVKVKTSKFDSYQSGFSLGGPIKKDKLFFFFNYEYGENTTPASNYIASKAGETGKNVSRVLSSDLDNLSNFLLKNYNYQTGAYQGISLNSTNHKFLIKLDYHINDKHNLTIRYNQLNAKSNQAPSNSTFFGAGNRFNNPKGMSYENSGWERNTSVYSFVSELKSNFNSKLSNNLKVGYSSFPESRSVKGTLFPSVDILKDSETYISFGSDLFSNNNKVNQNIIQIQNDLSLNLKDHALTFGINYQHYKFKNGFTPAWQGSYVYNSLEDFYNSTPLGTETPVGQSTGLGRPSSYARRYSGLENREVVFAEPKFSQTSFYVQDRYDVTDNFRLFGGVRLDITSFLNNPNKNTNLETLDFQNYKGDKIKLDNSILPKTQYVFSPRLGFNWHLFNRKIQLRGGTGIFNGIVPFVAIGDAYLNNGINQGEIRLFSFNGGTKDITFSPDVNSYIPEFEGQKSQGEVNFVSSDFKMPRIWKSTFGVDYKLTRDVIFSTEILYGKTMYDLLPTNANLDHKDGRLEGIDDRFRFSNSRVNYPKVAAAYVLGNSTEGHQFNATFQVEKPFRNNWSAMLAYIYGNSKDRSSFSGSGPRSAWRALPVVGNTNNPPLAYSDGDQKHRIIGSSTYKFDYNFGSSTFSVFFEGAQNRRFSYQYSGLVFQDANGDFVLNDLIFVPKDASQIKLADYTLEDGTVITASEQWNMLDKFISNSEYLNSRRGKFAERNGSLSPWYFQMDLKFLQNFYINVGKKKHTIQFSADILNFTNLLNSDWGIKKIPINTRPIQIIRNGSSVSHKVVPSNLQKGEFGADVSSNSLWQLQLGLRYKF